MDTQELPLFTVQFSVQTAWNYASNATLVSVDVFAADRVDAIEVARMTLRHPDQYDIDSVIEN